MEVTGAELKAFFRDWPMGDDWYHEDGLIEVDDETGEAIVSLEDTYDLDDQIGCLG